MPGDPWTRVRPVNICIVVAAPITLKAFLVGHLSALAERANITLVADFGPEDDQFPWPGNVSRIRLPIRRKIAPWSDGTNLFSLYRLFRRRSFDIVQSVTPKAGLLTMTAAWMARCPRRVHWFTGQVWVTRTGLMRALLKSADRLIARLASQILVDSASQRELLIAQGIVPAAKSAVLARGSICGVDTARFRPDAAARERVRRRHGIPVDSVVYLYLGRINRDKGVLDLAHAFADAGVWHGGAHMLLVGPDEGNLRAALASATAVCADRLHHADATDRPEEYFAAADVFCLPSYREGFGTTILEAAATGVPAVGSRIYGITDAIVEGETGLLFEAGDIGQLAQSLRTLGGDTGLRRSMGEKARERAVRDFSSAVVTAALLELYGRLLTRHGK
jgi:glycosyltransferase involved in cell wall biosynthesis